MTATRSWLVTMRRPDQGKYFEVPLKMVPHPVRLARRRLVASHAKYAAAM
jgi:hypothetical protein